MGSALAGALSLAQNGGTPPSVRGFPIQVLLPAAAFASGAVSVAFRDSRPSRSRWGLFVAGLLLLIWGVANIAVLWMPVLTSGISETLERAGAALVMWAGVGVATIAAGAVVSAASD